MQYLILFIVVEIEDWDTVGKLKAKGVNGIVYKQHVPHISIADDP
jgi:hypothetical protein